MAHRETHNVEYCIVVRMLRDRPEETRIPMLTKKLAVQTSDRWAEEGICVVRIERVTTTVHAVTKVLY